MEESPIKDCGERVMDQAMFMNNAKVYLRATSPLEELSSSAKIRPLRMERCIK